MEEPPPLDDAAPEEELLLAAALLLVLLLLAPVSRRHAVKQHTTPHTNNPSFKLRMTPLPRMDARGPGEGTLHQRNGAARVPYDQTCSTPCSVSGHACSAPSAAHTPAAGLPRGDRCNAWMGARD